MNDRTAFLPGNKLDITVGQELVQRTFDLSLDGQENDKKEINIKCKVIGILKNKSYIYTGQFNHSTPSVSDLFSKTTTNDEIIIIPNLFDEIPRYWAYQGMLIKYNNFENISTQIKENGKVGAI